MDVHRVFLLLFGAAALMYLWVRFQMWRDGEPVSPVDFERPKSPPSSRHFPHYPDHWTEPAEPPGWFGASLAEMIRRYQSDEDVPSMEYVAYRIVLGDAELRSQFIDHLDRETPSFDPDRDDGLRQWLFEPYFVVGDVTEVASWLEQTAGAVSSSGLAEWLRERAAKLDEESSRMRSPASKDQVVVFDYDADGQDPAAFMLALTTLASRDTAAKERGIDLLADLAFRVESTDFGDGDSQTEFAAYRAGERTHACAEDPVMGYFDVQTAVGLVNIILRSAGCAWRTCFLDPEGAPHVAIGTERAIRYLLAAGKHKASGPRFDPSNGLGVLAKQKILRDHQGPSTASVHPIILDD